MAIGDLRAVYSHPGDGPTLFLYNTESTDSKDPGELENVETIRVEWDEHLTAPEKKLLDKIARVFWNILSVLIPIIGLARLLLYFAVKSKLLPAASFSQEARNHAFQELLDSSSLYFSDPDPNKEETGLAYRAEEHWVYTPDNVKLSIKMFRCITNEETPTPTCIYFPANGEISDPRNLPNGLMSYCVEHSHPCNFVFFDYRGVGDSEGSMEVIQDLVTDGYSVTRWVEEVLQTPPDQIYFHGLSLGGAIAVETKALNPSWTGGLVNDRSFSTLANEVRVLVTETTGISWIGHLAASIVKYEGHRLDPARKITDLSGRVAVLYHEDDPIIPEGARMWNSLQAIENRDENFDIVPLTFDPLTQNVHGQLWTKIDRTHIGDFVLANSR